MPAPDHLEGFAGGEVSGAGDGGDGLLAGVDEVGVDVVFGGGLPSDQTDDGTDDSWELLLCKTIVLIRVELAEYLLEEGWHVSLGEGSDRSGFPR